MPRRALTPSSRGQPKSCAFCLPLMSNVRPKEREYKVSNELRRENLAARQSFRRNSRAFSTAGSQVTASAGRPRSAGRRTTCTLPRKSNSLSFAFGATGEEAHSESSFRSRTVLLAKESTACCSPRGVALVYLSSHVNHRHKTARLSVCSTAKVVVASTKA